MERVIRILRPTFTSVVHHWRGCPRATLPKNFLPLAYVSQMVGSSGVKGNGRKEIKNLSSSVVSQLRSSQKSEEVLTLVHANELNGNQASLALSALSNSVRFSNEENCKLPNDERFVSLLDTIATDVNKLSSESVVNSIINMFKLNQSESPVVRYLEKECRQRLRGMAVRHLVLIVCNTRLLSAHSQSALLAKEALRVLELRWKEMNSPYLLKHLLKTALHLSESFAEKLEDKTISMIDKFSFRDLVDISRFFASCTHRPLLLLRAISRQIDEQQSQWEVSQLIKLMKNMRTLKFNNYLFFKDVASFCKEHLQEFSRGQLAEVVRCFGQLHISEPDLYDAVCNRVKNHVTEFKVFELQTIAFGLSLLNLQAPTQLVERLITCFSSLSFPQQVEVCLSLAVFNACPDEQLKLVLESKCVSEIMGSNMPRYISLQLKLLHLNTFAKVESQSYTGPLISEGYMKYPKIENVTKSKLHHDVIRQLKTVLRNDNYFRSCVGLDSGYLIDAEVVVDKDGVPLSNIEYNVCSHSRNHTSLCKDLPESFLRVAIIVHGHGSYIYGTSDLTGRRHMMVRQLNALGYHQIQIPYEDWHKLKSDLKKVEYLRKKLEGVVTCLA